MEVFQDAEDTEGRGGQGVERLASWSPGELGAGGTEEQAEAPRSAPQLPVPQSSAPQLGLEVESEGLRPWGKELKIEGLADSSREGLTSSGWGLRDHRPHELQGPEMKQLRDQKFEELRVHGDEMLRSERSGTERVKRSGTEGLSSFSKRQGRAGADERKAEGLGTPGPWTVGTGVLWQAEGTRVPGPHEAEELGAKGLSSWIRSPGTLAEGLRFEGLRAEQQGAEQLRAEGLKRELALSSWPVNSSAGQEAEGARGLPAHQETGSLSPALSPHSGSETVLLGECTAANRAQGAENCVGANGAERAKDLDTDSFYSADSDGLDGQGGQGAQALAALKQEVEGLRAQVRARAADSAIQKAIIQAHEVQLMEQKAAIETLSQLVAKLQPEAAVPRTSWVPGLTEQRDERDSAALSTNTLTSNGFESAKSGVVGLESHIVLDSANSIHLESARSDFSIHPTAEVWAGFDKRDGQGEQDHESSSFFTPQWDVQSGNRATLHPMVSLSGYSKGSKRQGTGGSGMTTKVLLPSEFFSDKQRCRAEVMQRGLVNSMTRIEAEPSERKFYHFCVLCCGMPYRAPDPKRSGASALSVAAAAGSLENVKLLVSAGAEVNKTDWRGVTALMVAAKQGHPAIVKYLLESRARIGDQDKETRTALYYAAKKHQYEVIMCLLDAGAQEVQDEIEKSFSRCCWLRRLSSFQFPSQYNCFGFNLNRPKKPLSIAISTRDPHVIWNDKVIDVLSDTEFTSTCASGSISRVKELLKGGGKEGLINQPNAVGSTPLHQAAKGGHLDLVNLLIDEGAEIHQRNFEGLTPLCLAQKEKQADVVETLMQAGAVEMEMMEMQADCLKVWYMWYVKEALRSSGKGVSWKVWAMYVAVILIGVVQICFADSILRDNADWQQRKRQIMFTRWVNDEGCWNSLHHPLNSTHFECTVNIRRREDFREGARCLDYPHDFEDAFRFNCLVYQYYNICHSPQDSGFSNNPDNQTNGKASLPIPILPILNQTRLFQLLDSDQSGQLSYREFVSSSSLLDSATRQQALEDLWIRGAQPGNADIEDVSMNLQQFLNLDIASATCGKTALEACPSCGAVAPASPGELLHLISHHPEVGLYMAEKSYINPFHDYSAYQGYYFRYLIELQSVQDAELPVFWLVQTFSLLLIVLFCFNEVSHSLEIDIITTVIRGHLGNTWHSRVAGWAAAVGSVVAYRIVPITVLVTSWILVLESEDIIEIILNSLALIFILEMDEVLQVLVPRSGSRLMKLPVHKGWKHKEGWAAVGSIVTFILFPFVLITYVLMVEFYNLQPTSELLNPHNTWVGQVEQKAQVWSTLALGTELIRHLIAVTSRPQALDARACCLCPLPACCCCCCGSSRAFPVNSNLVIGVILTQAMVYVYYGLVET